MSNLNECDKMPTLTSAVMPDRFLSVKDYTEVIVAGLSILLGMGISIGGCALRVRDAKKIERLQEENRKMPKIEQKAGQSIPTTFKFLTR